MADWPITMSARNTVMGYTGSFSQISVIGSFTANTKGSWAQMIASTPHDFDALIVWFTQDFSNAPISLDIGWGASGSERVLIADLTSGQVQYGGACITIPIAVRAGTRLAMRTQSSTGGTGGAAAMIGLQGSLAGGRPFSSATTYGFTAATTRGTTIDPGTTAGTKGAWAQVAASTTSDIRGLFASVGAGGNSSLSTARFWFDIGVGASGFEQPIIRDFPMGTSASEILSPSWWPVIPVDIPLGSRLSARSVCNITGSARLLDITLHGLS